VLAAEQPQTYYQTPVWGPGGTHLYAQHFAQGAERVRRTLRLNLATGQVDTVVEDLGPFDVSADGRWLALARTTAEGPTLSVIDLQGGETRVLVDARQFEVINSPRFDPASQQLLFAAAPLGRLPSMQPAALIPFQVLAASATRHGPPQDLFVVPVSGGPYHRVAELAADDPSAAWSPDGTQLAILSVEALRTTGLAGDSTRLLLEPGSYGSVDWTR
jgi:Tol biopolymer transport system component